MGLLLLFQFQYKSPDAHPDQEDAQQEEHHPPVSSAVAVGIPRTSAVSYTHLDVYKRQVVPAAVFALVMDIVAVDRPVEGLLMAAAQASEIGVILIRCHHTCAMTLGAFHLNAGGEGVVCTVCKVGFINDSAHAPAHSFQKITFTAETGMVSNLLL